MSRLQLRARTWQTLGPHSLAHTLQISDIVDEEIVLMLWDSQAHAVAIRAAQPTELAAMLSDWRQSLDEEVVSAGFEAALLAPEAMLADSLMVLRALTLSIDLLHYDDSCSLPQRCCCLTAHGLSVGDDWRLPIRLES